MGRRAEGRVHTRPTAARGRLDARANMCSYGTSTLEPADGARRCAATGQPEPRDRAGRGSGRGAATAPGPADGAAVPPPGRRGAAGAVRRLGASLAGALDR